MMMADRLSKPLFEIRPDLVPYGRITTLEVRLWELHLTDQKNAENTRRK